MRGARGFLANGKELRYDCPWGVAASGMSRGGKEKLVTVIAIKKFIQLLEKYEIQWTINQSWSDKI